KARNECDAKTMVDKIPVLLARTGINAQAACRGRELAQFTWRHDQVESRDSSRLLVPPSVIVLGDSFSFNGLRRLRHRSARQKVGILQELRRV
ncbi:MAG: hypothetical protein OER87_15955, partial [Gammaproteobacteria bacterium]|nr:hypothetical protein [Gammaproteobacteria bacterium]